MFLTRNFTVKLVALLPTQSAVVVRSIEHASMNYLVLCVVFGVLGLYGLGFLWIRRVRYKEQVHIGATIIPHRSYYRKPHHYFLLFYTGSGRHAGTTANVYCVIHSKKKKTKPIVLRDPERLLFQSGTITSFLLTLNQSLDQITKIHLWHDISGPKPSWFLDRVIICHLNTGITWCFEGNCWLDVSDGETVECTLDALPRSTYLRRKPLFDKTFSDSFRNKHIWLSPFLLRNRTKFSRYEKLSTCCAVTMTTVLIVTVVVTEALENNVFPTSAIKIGPIEFQIADVLWSMISSVFPFLLRLGLELLFTHSGKRTQLASDENDVQGYMEECLRKANEITILEGQSNISSDSNDKIENGIHQHDRIFQPDLDGDRSAMNDSYSQRNEYNQLNVQDTISQSDRIRADSTLSFQTDNSFSEISLGEVGLHFEDDMTSFASSEGGFHINSDVSNMLERKANTVSPSNGNVVKEGNINPGFVENEISITELNEINQINSEKIDEKMGNGHCQEETGHGRSNTKSLSNEQNKHNGLLSNGTCCQETDQNQTMTTDGDTKQLNFAYTNSLTNIDKVPKLWKMLPLPGSLIDPNSFRIKFDNTSKLNRKFLYLAIAICVLMTMISIIVSLRFGLLWSLQKTTKWLIIIFLALFFQMFVMETLFMLSQSIYYAIILQRSTEENDVINEQKNKVWCKEEDDVRYYVDDLDDIGSPVPSPPSEEEVKKAREKAGQDRQLEEVLAMVAFDVLFLIQLVIIGFGNRDVEGYPMRVVMENNYNIAKFNLINNPKDFWSWSKDHLVAGLYYQGKFKEDSSRQTSDGYGTLLGVPILRQQRIKPNGTCTLNKYGKIAKFTQCNVALPDEEDYDQRQLYPGWKTRPSIDVISLSPWRYKTGSQSNTEYTAHTRIGSYEPGGYIASLGYNKTSALRMLNELEKLDWVDRFTRVVFIEYAVYNGNNNMLSSVLIAVEFTAFGGAFPSFEHFSYRLYRYFTTLQLAYLICEIMFVVFIVQLMYRVFCEIHEQRMGYFKLFWNWTDFVLVISSLATIGLYGKRAIQLQKGVSAITENPEVFFSFYSIGFYDNMVAYLSCIVVIIPMIQFFKFLKFNRSFMIFDKTLRLIVPDIAGFIFIFLISLACFAFWAFHMLRLDLEAYSSYMGSFNSILSMLLGKFSFRVFSPGSTQEYGPLFTYAFTVCNVFFIMTIILCIITLGFTTAKEEEVESKYQILKFIFNRVKDTLGLNPPYIPPKPVIKPPEIVDYAELHLQLNTKYIVSSQLSRMANFANTVYSEDTIDDFQYIERILGTQGCGEYLEETLRRRDDARRRHGNRLAITNIPDEEVKFDGFDDESSHCESEPGEERDNLSKETVKNNSHSKSNDFVV